MTDILIGMATLLNLNSEPYNEDCRARSYLSKANSST